MMDADPDFPPPDGPHNRSRYPARRPIGYERHREDLPPLKPGVLPDTPADVDDAAPDQKV